MIALGALIAFTLPLAVTPSVVRLFLDQLIRLVNLYASCSFLLAQGVTVVVMTAESRFWDLFTPTVLDHLSYHLTIAEIINLSRTCRGLSGFYEAMLPRKWSIDPSLRRFVDKPQAFRQQIGLAEALLAGDFPQEFFERDKKKAMALDIVANILSTPVLATYLELREGYVVDDQSSPNDADNTYRHVDKVAILA